MSSVRGSAAGSVKTPVRTKSFLPKARWRAIASSLDMSSREAEVVEGILAGGNDALIGERLGISAHTVHTYLDRLYRKLRVNTRCGLVLRIFAAYVALESRGNIRPSRTPRSTPRER